MINFEFDSSKYQEGYQLIPAGNYSVRIEDASERVSKSGLDMIRLTLVVPNYSTKVYHHLVVNPAHMELTHQYFGEFFASFSITPGDMDLSHWLGRTGAARIKHGEYQGEARAEIGRFLSQRQQKELGLSANANDENCTSVRDDFSEDPSDCPF